MPLRSHFLLDFLRRIGHIALARLFHANDKADITTLDKDFLELSATFLVLQTVDGEDLLLVGLCQGQGIGNRRELLLELALVEQDKHTRVADDGILDNLIARDVLNILSDHADGSPVLTGCLVEVLDIFGHRRGGNGFPCLFNHQRLTAFLDTHLLGEAHRRGRFPYRC